MNVTDVPAVSIRLRSLHPLQLAPKIRSHTSHICGLAPWSSMARRPRSAWSLWELPLLLGDVGHP